MQTTIWIISGVAVAVLILGAVWAARLGRRRFVPAAPAPTTISVTEPTVDTLESPRHAAEARALEQHAHVDVGGTHRRTA
jgi:hypothetical protein